MRSMVTGGAGFIGSHICDKLIELGHEVICVDNLSAGSIENIQHLSKNKNFEFHKMDVTDDDIDILMDGVDTIFHNAASKKNICLKDPMRDLFVNAGGTLNLLTKAKELGVKKFVHASTGSVYGEPVVFPQTEHHRLHPTSYYGVSKLAGERYVDTFNKLYGLDTTILRYFHVYGPRQDAGEFGGVISIFIKNILDGKPIRIFGDGKQERSFTFIDDIVSANIEAATNKNSSGKVYNCASGIKVTINELVDYLSQLMKVPVEKIYEDRLVGDIDHFDVENDLISFDLGIRFLQDIRIGLLKTIKSFK